MSGTGKDVKYIAEKKLFIIDGKTVREGDLTPTEAARLKAEAAKVVVVFG